MLDREQDHVAAGSDGGFRWIEAGRLRLVEAKEGADVTIQAAPGPTRLSATELLGLVRQLAAWFDDDPADKILQIESCAKYVLIELEKWNARARIDEEHPPYDKLTSTLDVLVGICSDLREAVTFGEGGK